MEVKIKIAYDENSKFTVVVQDPLKGNKLQASELPWIKSYPNSRDLIPLFYNIISAYPCQEVTYVLEVQDNAREILDKSYYSDCLEDIIDFQNKLFSPALVEK